MKYELAEALRFIRRDRLLLWLITFTALVTLLVAPLPSVLLPVYVQATYGGALRLGVLITAFGIGLLVGAIFYGLAGHRLSRGGVVVVGVGALGVMGLVLSVSPPFEVLLLAALLGGALYGPFSPLLSTVVGERAPEEMRGRVFGTLSAASTVTVPIGVLVVGLGIEAVGVGDFVVIIAISLLAVAGAISFGPALRELETGATEKLSEKGHLGFNLCGTTPSVAAESGGTGGSYHRP